MTDQKPAWDRPEVLAVVDRDGDVWGRDGDYGLWWYGRRSEPPVTIDDRYGPCIPLVRESPSITLAEHAASLARVADHAHAQGWREGHGQACEDAYERGVMDGKDAHAPLTPRLTIGEPVDLVTLTARPSISWEYVRPDFALAMTTCGFACHCRSIPEPWVVGVGR